MREINTGRKMAQSKRKNPVFVLVLYTNEEFDRIIGIYSTIEKAQNSAYRAIEDAGYPKSRLAVFRYEMNEDLF